MPTIQVTLAGAMGTTTVDSAFMNVVTTWAYLAPVDLGAVEFAGTWDLDLSEIPVGSVFRITAVDGTFGWSVTGDGIGALAAYVSASGTANDGAGSLGLIEGGGPWNAPPYAPFSSSASAPLTLAGTFVVEPISRSVTWRISVIWGDITVPFTNTSTITFTLSPVEFTLDYETGVVEGTLLPHLELSETQEAHGPLPATATIEATIEDDGDGIFTGASIAWELVGAPSEASGFPWASVLIQDPDALSTAVHFTEYRQGTFVFAITVTATTGEILTGFAAVTIGPSVAPRVESGLFVIHYPETITVNPEVIDYGWNGPLAYLWEQVGGPVAATIASPTTKATLLTFPEMDGSYLFRLTVSNDLLSGTGITKIVQAANISPAPLTGGQLYVTIAGTEYAAGR